MPPTTPSAAVRAARGAGRRDAGGIGRVASAVGSGVAGLPRIPIQDLVQPPLIQEGYSGASEWDWWGSWGDPGRGRVQICHKGAPGRDRSRRKPRNINDSSCAPRLDWGLCGRFGHGPGPDRVRLVPRDPRAPSVSGSASRRPSRGRTWRPGRIVPGRTRLRGRQNRAIMRKPTDTPGAAARTILPGRQNRVRAPGPARPRPRHGAPVQQIRTHPAPQAPYAPLRHTQNNRPGSLWQIWTTGAAAGPVVRASPASARSMTSTPARTPARRTVADRASAPFDRAGPARAPPGPAQAPQSARSPLNRLFAFEGVVGGANRILRRLPSGGP